MAAGQAEFSVRSEFDGSTILLTGVSGYLGSLVLELLLRTTNVRKVYALIRGRRGSSAQQRLEALLQSGLFHLVRDRPELLDKVVGVEGDLLHEGLGLSARDRQLLEQDVRFVIHSAANIELEADIQHTLDCNYVGTRRLLHLARAMPLLRCFLHVSTAFVNVNRPAHSTSLETVYPLCLGTQRVIHSDIAEELLGLDPAKAAQRAQLYMHTWGFPNTYTLGKHLTEEMVVEASQEAVAEQAASQVWSGAGAKTAPGCGDTCVKCASQGPLWRKDSAGSSAAGSGSGGGDALCMCIAASAGPTPPRGLPIAVVRPSLVSSVSSHGPYPGYCGNLTAPLAMALALAVGLFDRLDSVALAPTHVWDGVPGDLVSAAILAAAAATAAHAPLRLRDRAPGEPLIVHAATSTTHPVYYVESVRYKQAFFASNPPPFRLPGSSRFELPLYHKPQAKAVDRAKRRVARKVSLLVRLLRLLGHTRAAKRLKFGLDSWLIQNSFKTDKDMSFGTNHLRDLEAGLDPAEAGTYMLTWTTARGGWERYTNTCLAGLWSSAFGIHHTTGVEHDFVLIPNRPAILHQQQQQQQQARPPQAQSSSSGLWEGLAQRLGFKGRCTAAAQLPAASANAADPLKAPAEAGHAEEPNEEEGPLARPLPYSGACLSVPDPRTGSSSSGSSIASVGCDCDSVQSNSRRSSWVGAAECVPNAASGATPASGERDHLGRLLSDAGGRDVVAASFAQVAAAMASICAGEGLLARQGSSASGYEAGVLRQDKVVLMWQKAAMAVVTSLACAGAAAP